MADCQDSATRDLTVARNRRPALRRRVLPDGMLRALADQPATVIPQVSLETLSLDHARTLRRVSGSGERTVLMFLAVSTLPCVSKRLSLTAVYESVEGGWTQARIAELPAVITAAPTQDTAREALFDALSEYLVSLGDETLAEQMGPEAIREEFQVVLGV